MRTSRTDDPDQRGGPSVVRRSLRRFVLLSFLALLVLAFGIQVISADVAEREATRDAVSRTRGFAEGVAAPLVDQRVRDGEPEAMAELAGILRSRLLEGGTFAHFVVYDVDGTIIWSDAAKVIGRKVDLEPAVRAGLGQHTTVSALPGQGERHPERIGDEDGLLEVYVTTVGADGRPFVFEAYTPPDRIAIDSDAFKRELLPLGLGGLLLFQLAVLPLAWSLARNVDRERRRRSEVLERSLQEWHVERRRLAQELHDGVIQDLSAAGYAMPAILQDLPAGTSGESARRMGKQIAHLIEQDLGMMRSLVGDLVPDELEGLEVADAIETVVSRHRHGGLLVHSTVATADEPGPVVTGVVYRVVREALRNVERHAAAQNAWVDLEQVADSYVLTVRDDGRGVSGRDVTQETDAEGHFGLVLLESLVRDVGGTLSLEDHPTYGGSLLTVRIPATTPR